METHSRRTFEEAKRCPVSPSYYVTESGNVGRIGTEGFKKPCVLKRGGYLAVSLWENNKGKTWPVHILVALAFHGERPPKHDAAHSYGDKLNNHQGNIRWATRAENEADKVRHGTSNRGERNGQAKLTDAQARELIVRVDTGESRAALAAEYGITASGISQIYRRTRRATSTAKV